MSGQNFKDMIITYIRQRKETDKINENNLLLCYNIT